MSDLTQVVLIPTAHYGFDPTEVAIPWKILTSKGYKVVFATPSGKVSSADKIMLTGKKLGLLASSLMARQDAIEAYSQMMVSAEFNHPISYSQIESNQYDGLLLPGGHDKAIREYLESKILQAKIVEFVNKNKIIGAICHGVILAARSIDPATTQSILFNKQTTALLKSQEKLAFYLTRLWLGDYYLTYPEITVEDEVKAVLADPSQFKRGLLPIYRDTASDQGKSFVVKDGNYISARWPGDIYKFSNGFVELLKDASE